ncbi:MAG: hypothetical protein ACF788_00810, partial [Novipirellula sp. JB048]
MRPSSASDRQRNGAAIVRRAVIERGAWRLRFLDLVHLVLAALFGLVLAASAGRAEAAAAAGRDSAADAPQADAPQADATAGDAAAISPPLATSDLTSDLTSDSASASAVAARSAPAAILPPLAATIRLPTTKANRLGFTIDIQLAKQQAAGTIPVKIDVRSTSTFAADRELTIRFVSDPQGQSPPTNGLRVEVPISLAQGTRASSVTRYLPKWSFGYLYHLAVYEQNRALENCSAKLGGSETNISVDQLQLRWLLVTASDEVDHARLPDLRALLRHRPWRGDSWSADELPAPDQGPRLWASILSEGPNIAAGQSQLPADWRGYQDLSLLVLDRSAVESAKRRGNFQPIRDWVLNGGSIALYGVASEQEFVEALGLPDEPPADLGLVVPVPESIGTLSRETPPGVFSAFVRAHTMAWEQRTWLRPLGAGLAFGLQSSPDERFPAAAQWNIVKQTIG